jgi:hypothetical protein
MGFGCQKVCQRTLPGRPFGTRIFIGDFCLKKFRGMFRVMGKVREWNKTGFAYKFLHGLPDSGGRQIFDVKICIGK